jgi:hypothetical protein
MALRLDKVVCLGCRREVEAPRGEPACNNPECRGYGLGWLCPRCGVEATLVWQDGAATFTATDDFAVAEPTRTVVDAVCFKCHPADEPRQVQRWPRPGMLAKVKGVAWEVTQVGMGSGDVLWANLVPVGGGEQRAAFSPLSPEPEYQLEDETVRFEG